MELSGATESINTMFESMPALFAQQGIPVPEKMADAIKKFYNDLLDDMVFLYEKNISLDDMKALNAFYESDLGKRISKGTINISKETPELTQRKINEFLQEIMSELSN